MASIFEQLNEMNDLELTGLAVNASITVPERLLNDMLSAELRENKTITYCRISIEPQNRVDVHLKTTFWPWPLTLKLKLFSSMDIKPSLTVRAFLENHVLLAKLGSLLKALPSEVHLYQDQVSVDIGALMKEPPPPKILALLRAANVQTDIGQVILEVRMEA